LFNLAFSENIDIIALTDANTQENFYYLKENAHKIIPEYKAEDLGPFLKISNNSDEYSIIASPKDVIRRGEFRNFQRYSPCTNRCSGFFM